MLSHKQFLCDDIFRCHHADEVDAGREIPHVDLTAVVVDILVQYRSAVVVINRQFADPVDRGTYVENILCRIGVE